MYKVGLTGGIGSGKSTVGKIFENLGIPVYNSDLRARILIQEDPYIIAAYQKFFGAEIYNQGVLDRSRVAALLFNNGDLLQKVQAIVHPVVNNDFNNWVQFQSGSVVMKEAAVLFEGGGVHTVDDVLTVTAPLNLRIQRVVTRDHISDKEVMDRVNKQWSDEKKIALSRYVVYADDCQLVIPQVLDVYRQIVLVSNGRS